MRLAPFGTALFALAFTAGLCHAQWTPGGVRLSGAAGIQRDPYVAFDGHGSIVAWEDQRAGTGNSDIYAGRVLPTGALPEGWAADGVALCTATGNQSNPRIVPDASGGAYVTWEDARAGASNYDIYIQRLGSDGLPALGWPANGLALCTASGNQSVPVICPDGAGGAIVAWVDDRSGAGASDIYGTRVLANATVAAGWPANGRAICDTTDLQILQAIAPDGSGGVLLAWVDRRSGTEYDLFAHRILGNGARATGWPVQGAPVTRATGDQTSPVVAEDGAGGVFVVWNDFRQGEGHVFAQHLTPTGGVAAGWVADGNVLCDIAGSQYAPQAAPDGQGGFFAVWEDYRSDGDVYAIRVQADGSRATGWAEDGSAVCDVAALQLSPVVMGDGSGGAFFAWSDQRNVGFNNDIWALHLNGDASLAGGWTDDGVALCTAGGFQYYPTLAPDGAGGAYVTWQDRRNLSNFDVYVTRVGPAPTPVADAATLAPRKLALSVSGANPFRGRAALQLALPMTGRAHVAVVDLAGRHVRTLLEGTRGAGLHELGWDGLDESGAPQRAGVYFVRASSEQGTALAKLVRVH